MKSGNDENHEFYASLIENLPEGIIIHDLKKIKFVNKTLSKITGYTKDELLKMKPNDLLPVEERERLSEYAIKRLKGEKTPTHYRAKLMRKNGTEVACDFWASSSYYRGEKSIVVIVRDISFEVKMEEKISELETLLTEVINTADDGIYVREAKSGKIVFANKKFSEIHGIPLEKIIGMNSRDLLTEKEKERLKKKTLNKIPKRIELRAKGPKEKEIIIEETVGAIKNKRGELEYIFGIVRDITKKKKYEAKLKKLAINDALTGIFNRHFFNEFIYKEWDRNKRFKQSISFILVDIDNFKSINDNFGHLFGDFILKEVAKILSMSLRNSDFVVRFGGDEFLIVLPQTEKGVELVEDRILKNLRKWNERNKDKNIVVSLSFGSGTFYPYKGDTVERALREIDRRMYEDKYRKESQR